MASVIDNCKVAVFPAPVGDYRQIVLDYMIKMSQVKWTPKRTFTITKKGPTSNVNLTYEKGETYYGVTYSGTKCTLDQFEQLVEDGVFTNNAEYFDEIVGNHCSSSISMALQQIISNGGIGGTKPQKWYPGIFKFPNDIKIPFEHYGDDYTSFEIWNFNSKVKIFEAYAMLKPADILYYCKKNAGHVRMVYREASVVYNEDGSINGDESKVSVIEQTNAWDKTVEHKTTWFVDRSYTFNKLYEKHFMPITLEIYTNGEETKDAYIILDEKNSASDLKNGLKGNIKSTFPLNYAYVTVKDSQNQIVRKCMKNNFTNVYSLSLADMNETLDFASLPKGKYKYNLRIAIARGGIDLEQFEFEI
ncbi:MAG: hypothetical protein IKU45_05260 [Clostridia bacterium]|nr:hypothetical protein [Clostridia bacterium]